MTLKCWRCGGDRLKRCCVRCTLYVCENPECQRVIDATSPEKYIPADEWKEQKK